MIFLNIDYDYFFDSQEDVSLNKNKKRWADPINFFSNINLELIKERYCFLDHHQALYYWDQINCSNIHCIHVDAHHIHPIQYNSHQYIIYLVGIIDNRLGFLTIYH